MQVIKLALDLALESAPGLGLERTFNLASAYVTWEKVARMAAEVTGASARVEVVPSAQWTGAAFLADRWELDDRRICEALGFKPARDPAGVREALRRAMARTWRATAGTAG